MFVNEAFLDLYGLSPRRGARQEARGSARRRRLAGADARSRSRGEERGADVRARRSSTSSAARAGFARAACPTSNLDGSVARRIRRRPRHHRSQGRAGRAGRARIAAARDHGRRARAGRVHRPRRALPLRQPDVPPVFRPDRRAGRPSAAARSRRAGHLRERAGDADARAAGRIDGVRSAGAGRQRRAPLDDDPRRARRRPVGRGQRRVRADERHPWPEAGAGGVARVRRRAAAHHGQRAGARVVHRSRISLPLPQRPQRGMARRQPQRHDRPAAVARSPARRASRCCSRCSIAC